MTTFKHGITRVDFGGYSRFTEKKENVYHICNMSYTVYDRGKGWENIVVTLLVSGGNIKLYLETDELLRKIGEQYDDYIKKLLLDNYTCSCLLNTFFTAECFNNDIADIDFNTIKQIKR